METYPRPQSATGRSPVKFCDNCGIELPWFDRAQPATLIHGLNSNLCALGMRVCAKGKSGGSLPLEWPKADSRFPYGSSRSWKRTRGSTVL